MIEPHKEAHITHSKMIHIRIYKKVTSSYHTEKDTYTCTENKHRTPKFSLYVDKDILI